MEATMLDVNGLMGTFTAKATTPSRMVIGSIILFGLIVGVILSMVDIAKT